MKQWMPSIVVVLCAAGLGPILGPFGLLVGVVAAVLMVRRDMKRDYKKID